MTFILRKAIISFLVAQYAAKPARQAVIISRCPGTAHQQQKGSLLSFCFTFFLYYDTTAGTYSVDNACSDLVPPG